MRARGRPGEKLPWRKKWLKLAYARGASKEGIRGGLSKEGKGVGGRQSAMNRREEEQQQHGERDDSRCGARN